MFIKDFSASFSTIGGPSGFLSEDISSTGPPFSFDPNTASYDTLIKLGFAAKEANTLIKYRNKGGKFRQPEDIKKIYGIEEEKAEKLIPFVEVKNDTTQKVRVTYPRQQKALIDINNCDSVSLVSLPGIGPVLSARIIKYRKLLGGFAKKEQIKEVYGLSEETYDLISGSIFADSSAITRINVNSADYKELAKLIYLEKYEVTAILKYRDLMGRVTGIADLVENKLINKEKASKVEPYLNFK